METKKENGNKKVVLAAQVLAAHKVTLVTILPVGHPIKFGSEKALVVLLCLLGPYFNPLVRF